MHAELMLLRHALSASVTNRTSYGALHAEIALPRICHSYLSDDRRFAFKTSTHLLFISSSTAGNKISQYAKVVCFSLLHTLLLTEFEGRTVSYGPSLSRSLMAQARSARAINLREKTRIRNLQYGP